MTILKSKLNLEKFLPKLFDMALEDLEKELYGMKRGEEEKREEIKEEKPPISEIPSGWTRKQEEVRPSVKRPSRPPIHFYQSRRPPVILYGILIFLLLILSGEGLLLYKKLASRERGVGLNFSLPEEIYLGAPFELKVEYFNNSQNLLKEASLILKLPKEFKSLSDITEDSVIIKRNLGDLATGTKASQNFLLIFIGKPHQVVQLEVVLQYNIVGFSGRFEKKFSRTITTNGPVLDFNLVLPEKIINGEDFVIQIEYFNRFAHPLKGLKFQLFYPLGFNFKNANLTPYQGNNIWLLPSLEAKTNGKLEIQGNIIGQIGSFYEFGVQPFLIISDQISPISLEKKVAQIKLEESLLHLAILVNNSDNYIASPGEELTYQLGYKNNSSVTLEEVIIRAYLEGEMFDFQSIKTNGYFDSLSRQIIWQTATQPNLKMIQPGEEGKVEFKIYVKKDFPIKGINDKHFVLKVKMIMESPSVLPRSGLNKTVVFSENQTKVKGKTVLLSYALYRDPASGIINKGSLPLRVNQSVNFTVHWKIINYANDLSDIKIRSYLGPGVGWTGMIAGNYGDSPPKYNERTGEVIWEIENLPATTGLVLPAREVIFQVVVTPSLNQIDKYVKILETSELIAQDVFTGEKIRVEAPSIDSRLANDPTVKADEGKVHY